jgi:hypothetical protein
MGTLKRTRNLVLTGAAALAMIGCGVSLAFGTTAGQSGPAAAKTWTVSPGGNVSSIWTKTVLTDTVTHAEVTCQATVANGAVESGPGLSGTHIGQATEDPTFTDCGGPGGSWWTVWPVPPPPWPWINAVSFNANTGVATGTLTGVTADIGVESGGCSAELDGTAAGADDGVLNGTYSDATGTGELTGGDLHVYDVQDCAGAFNNGDPVTVTGSFTLSPQQVITSP